eukprot:TRINITY_DN6207_c0_g1_i1.p1 TRINITY_DN6207_c0_g1~~TRINITY_DN6207_c0_g1_i1.p1  ORF type:complete len:205 (+),score=57.20 TRINITY_DN6207_c0_g1_i1:46-615(+)
MPVVEVAKNFNFAPCKVWDVIGRYDMDWVPNIGVVEMDGLTRTITHPERGATVEKVTKVGYRSYTTDLVTSPLPLKSCQSTLSLDDLGYSLQSGLDFSCTATWKTEYEFVADVPAGAQQQVAALLQQTGRDGLAAAEQRLLGEVEAAKDYLTRHRLAETIDELIQSVIRDRPDEPLRYMRDELDKLCNR